jgi:hypothetical protein
VIAAKVERAQQSELAVDAPLRVLEFQRFLVVQQRAIATVVADAQELSRVKSAVLQNLRGQYSS